MYWQIVNYDLNSFKNTCYDGQVKNPSKIRVYRGYDLSVITYQRQMVFCVIWNMLS